MTGPVRADGSLVAHVELLATIAGQGAFLRQQSGVRVVRFAGEHQVLLGDRRCRGGGGGASSPAVVDPSRARIERARIVVSSRIVSFSGLVVSSRIVAIGLALAEFVAIFPLALGLAGVLAFVGHGWRYDVGG